MLLGAFFLSRCRRELLLPWTTFTLFLVGLWIGGPTPVPRMETRVFREHPVTGLLDRSPEPALEGERILLMREDRTGKRYRLRVGPSTPEVMESLDRRMAGDHVRVWCRSGVPTGYGNPGAGDPAARLAAAGIQEIGTVKSARLVELIATGRWSPARAADQVRNDLRRGLCRVAGHDPVVLGVLSAMLLGERAGLDPAVSRTMRRAGLFHLIAISGLHVGLILLVVLRFFRRVPVPKPVRIAAMPVTLAALILLTGGRASVLRAALAAGLAGAGRALGRGGNTINTLSLAGLVLLLLDPPILQDVGFQLSFGAAFGIVLGWRPLQAAVPLPRFLSAPWAVSAAAYLGTAPWSALRFGTLAPAAMLTNLVCAPLCGGILLGGYPAAVLAAWGGDGGLPGTLAVAACRVLLGLAEWGARIPFGTLRVAEPPTWILLVVLTAPLLLRRGGRRASLADKFPPVLVLFAFILLHLGRIPGPPEGGNVQLVLPDVGQGQAVLIHRGDRSILIDAGGNRSPGFDPGERLVSPVLSRDGIHRLEILALTHEHIDHAGGAAAILRDFEVGDLWIAPGMHRSPRIRRLEALARRKGAGVVMAARGRSRRGPDFSVAVLHPRTGDAGSAVNERSMVLRIEAGRRSILVPGDLEKIGEVLLLGRSFRGPPALRLNAEVLVAGHHGAGNSTGRPFLSAVNPAVAVISAGRRNRFGHPDPNTLRRLEESGASVLCTARSGMIRLEGGTDGWRIIPGSRKGKAENRAGR